MMMMAFLIPRIKDLSMGQLESPKIDGLILAGGKSARFGSNKATYLYEGQRMVDWVADHMRPLVSVLTLSLGSSKVELDDAELVYDSTPDLGALGGLLCGLKNSREDWVLVCPVDMPCVDTMFFAKILAARTEAVVAVIAKDAEDVIQPLCGVFRRDLIPSLEKAVSQNCLRVLDWIETIEYVTIAGEMSSLKNINYRPEKDS